MRHLAKPRFIKFHPRAKIIYRNGFWNVHILQHPIENAADENRIGFGTKPTLPQLHQVAAQTVRTIQAETEQP